MTGEPQYGELYQLQRFSLADTVAAGAALRGLGTAAATMAEAAQEVVGWLNVHLVDANAEPACVLVRVFRTHAVSAMPEDLQVYAREAADGPLAPEARCLVLLATAGVEPAWNDPNASEGHRVIPLTSDRAVLRLPMISQLLQQLGVEVARVVQPTPALLIGGDCGFDVFHVPEAADSPHIPAQDFVRRYGVRSVVGFGGALPDGELFATILFSRVPIDDEQAQLFRNLAPAVKLALLPSAHTAFEGVLVPARGLDSARANALDELLTIHEELVVVQTRAAEWARIEEARHSAELVRSNAALQEFAHVVSHDLREPLRVIAGFSSLIAQKLGDSADTDLQRYLRFMVDGVQRMVRLLDGVLTYARLGTHPIVPVRVSAEDVLRDALSDLGAVIAEAGAVVAYDALPEVHADPVLLGQVFQNLISNAIKFRGKAQPSVRVSARREEGAWVFCVADNGLGIEAADQDRIFQIFRRAHGEGYPGMGVGLAICRQAIGLHGGHIWVDSVPGRGATFSFTIPDGKAPG
ncbi:MAG: ATP-binding protein [Pseudomonadota bacterium]|nr:ATP-binding protein [Pseudomonadota bacterium]